MATPWILDATSLAQLTCCSILILSCLIALKDRPSRVKAPLVGRRSFLEPGWLVGLRFTKGSRLMILEGYQKYKNSMFKIRRTDGEILVISNKYVNELRNLPEEVLSSMRAQARNTVGRYTGTTILTESDLHRRVVQEKLNPRLGTTIPAMKDELDFAIRSEMPDCEDTWAKVQLFEILVQMVARVSARIFVGPTVCRNEEWLRVSTKYTENVFVTAIALRLFPSFLHPLVALFLPSRWHVQANLGAAKRIISPIVRGRRVAEARDASYKKPEDLLQWMMDTARPNTREGDPDELAHRQLLLSLASIHTTTMALVHVLYDLCARPDFLEPLRDEITTVLLAEGKNGLCWQQNTLQKLRKLDSFIKESQRFSPLSHLSFNRLACETITLSDGTVLPHGTHMAVASQAILMDMEKKGDVVPGIAGPMHMDPFRYSRVREDASHPENAHRYQFVTTDENNLHFGHGRLACVGRFFASSEIKMVLAHLLLAYDFAYPEGQLRPWNLTVDENIFPDPAARVLVRKRKIEDATLRSLIGIR